MADLFLSYSRKDIEVMHKVRDYLRSKDITVWTDERLTPGTPNWQVSIENAIRECKGLVILLSPSAANSKWVREEQVFASNLEKPVFALLVKGDKTNAVPFGFGATQWINIKTDFEEGMKSLVAEFDRRGWVEKAQSPLIEKKPKKKTPKPKTDVADQRSKVKKEGKLIPLWGWLGGVAVILLLGWGALNGGIAPASDPAPSNTPVPTNSPAPTNTPSATLLPFTQTSTSTNTPSPTVTLSPTPVLVRSEFSVILRASKQNVLAKYFAIKSLLEDAGYQVEIDSNISMWGSVDHIAYGNPISLLAIEDIRLLLQDKLNLGEIEPIRLRTEDLNFESKNIIIEVWSFELFVDD